MLVALALAVFGTRFYLSTREVHEVLRDVDFGPAYTTNAGRTVVRPEDAVRQLGGGERAASRLALYLRLPKWAAPHKDIAVHLLGYCGKTAVPVLLRVLKHEDTGMHLAAAGALARIGLDTEKAVPALVKGLADKKTRGPALWTLGKIGPAAKDAVPALVGLLQDKAASLIAVQILGTIGPGASEAVPALQELLQDEAVPSHVRQATARALGKIGAAAKPAVPALKELLQDKSPNVRSAAAEALKKIETAQKDGE